MIQRYRSKYPNHVHQLAGSVSRHFYAGTDGLLKYQKKPFEVSLINVSEQRRRHMIVYTVRDHCSGLFYAEIYFGPAVPSILRFLDRAWSPKSDYIFHGVPELLLFPRTLDRAFPKLKALAVSLGVGLPEVTSGFQSGIRDIRTIEDNLIIAVGQSTDTATNWVHKTCLFMAEEKARTGIESKLELWKRSIPEVRLPPTGWANGA